MIKLLLTSIVLLSMPLKASFLDNFHTVEKEKLYRSKQLSAKKFQKYINRHGIKTVINLRGKSSKSWYKEEEQVMKEMGVDHINIDMSAKRLPHKEDLQKLIHSFDHAKRPILIHCQGGADRTGEASAMYQMMYMGKSKKEALKMLTFKYWHLKSRMPAKRYFIDKLWKGAEWGLNEYDPCQAEYKYYNKQKYCNESE